MKIIYVRMRQDKFIPASVMAIIGLGLARASRYKIKTFTEKHVDAFQLSLAVA